MADRRSILAAAREACSLYSCLAPVAPGRARKALHARDPLAGTACCRANKGLAADMGDSFGTEVDAVGGTDRLPGGCDLRLR